MVVAGGGSTLSLNQTPPRLVDNWTLESRRERHPTAGKNCTGPRTTAPGSCGKDGEKKVGGQQGRSAQRRRQEGPRLREGLGGRSRITLSPESTKGSQAQPLDWSGGLGHPRTGTTHPARAGTPSGNALPRPPLLGVRRGCRALDPTRSPPATDSRDHRVRGRVGRGGGRRCRGQGSAGARRGLGTRGGGGDAREQRGDEAPGRAQGPPPRTHLGGPRVPGLPGQGLLG